MTRIYTPKRWMSFFRGYPELVIDDDGFIYNGADYNKLGRAPVGKIDEGKGEVYGENYNSMFPVPIGYIRAEDGVKKVYAEPDSSRIFGSFPVLYITDGKIYTYDDYNRLFPTSSGYIDRDAAKGQALPEKEPALSKVEEPVSWNEGSGDGGNPVAVILVLFFCFMGVCIWLYPPTLFRNLLVAVPLSAVGSVVAYKQRPQKWKDAFITVLTVYVIVFVVLFALETLFSLIINGFKWSELALIVASPIPGIIFGILPSAIGAWAVIRIQKSKS